MHIYIYIYTNVLIIYVSNIVHIKISGMQMDVHPQKNAVAILHSHIDVTPSQGLRGSSSLCRSATPGFVQNAMVGGFLSHGGTPKSWIDMDDLQGETPRVTWFIWGDSHFRKPPYHSIQDRIAVNQTSAGGWHQPMVFGLLNHPRLLQQTKVDGWKTKRRF